MAVMGAMVSFRNDTVLSTARGDHITFFRLETGGGSSTVVVVIVIVVVVVVVAANAVAFPIKETIVRYKSPM